MGWIMLPWQLILFGMIIFQINISVKLKTLACLFVVTHRLNISIGKKYKACHPIQIIVLPLPFKPLYLGVFIAWPCDSALTFNANLSVHLRKKDF